MLARSRRDIQTASPTPLANSVFVNSTIIFMSASTSRSEKRTARHQLARDYPEIIQPTCRTQPFGPHPIFLEMAQSSSPCLAAPGRHRQPSFLRSHQDFNLGLRRRGVGPVAQLG